MAISEQYGIPRSSLYYWISRLEAYQTYENRSTAPHKTHGKITEEVKAAVLEKHHKNPRLGSWRLSLFEYEGEKFSHESTWFILMEARHPKLPPKFLYHLTHPYQIWFIDHMHLRTLPNGQKFYSLIVLDGFTRVLLSDEICLSRTAREACLILLRAFARWGLPEEIISDNEKSFTSLLYRLLMGVLRGVTELKLRYDAISSLHRIGKDFIASSYSPTTSDKAKSRYIAKLFSSE